MQMDIERLCLENALKRFLRSGSKPDAFDVYFCYMEMFFGVYKDIRRIIEMLSEFETNGSSLLMKHRDHYSHSVYVFALGLAIYDTTPSFRNTYKNFYFKDYDKADIDKKAAAHFLEFWGMTSLFHDIGYPFELPFEQMESYFEVKGQKRKNNPFLAVIGMDKYTKIDNNIREILKKEYEKDFSDTDELFAYDIVKKFKSEYHITVDALSVFLSSKPSNPDRFNYYMDHAYFSATVLFKELSGISGNNSILTAEKIRCQVDALTAILLHNSLYKFLIASYKDESINKPLKAQLHPLAYLLMICDELQCWDRTSYGRNSRSELHPHDCKFEFDDNDNIIKATYYYDSAELNKIKYFEEEFEKWQNGGSRSKPELKAYSSMVKTGDDCDFLADIAKIVDVSDESGIQLVIEKDCCEVQRGDKKTFLSSSNFLHLYDFAVILNEMYNLNLSNDREKEEALNDFSEYFRKKIMSDEKLEKMEENFAALSLEYKISNIGQAKAFAEYLDKINCMYTDKPVDLKMLDKFSEDDLAVIGPLEHGRWLTEHYEMGWRYGSPAYKKEREQKRIHKDMIKGEDDIYNITNEADKERFCKTAAQHYKELGKDEQDKDTMPMTYMLELIKEYDGLRIYSLNSRK